MESKSTKKLIIQILGTEFPLTLKQIHTRSKKEKSTSYQAIYNLMNDLLAEGIVEKIEKHYFLNKKWIQKETDQFSRMYANYYNAAYNPNQINVNNKIQVFRFTSVKEMVDFVMEAYIQGKLDQSSSKKIYASLKRLLPFIPQNLISHLRKLREQEIYVLCHGDDVADRWTAKFYRSCGMKVKTGIKIRHFNSICFGDCAVQYYFFINDAYRQSLYDFATNISKKSSLHLMKMTMELLHKNVEVFLVLNRHPLLVDDIKQSVVAEF